MVDYPGLKWELALRGRGRQILGLSPGDFFYFAPPLLYYSTGWDMK